MDRTWIGWTCGAVRVALVIGVGSAALPGRAAAQEVNEDYIVWHLGPAAEQMEAAGVDGSPESSPMIIEIAQRWLIEPAFWVSVDEAHMLVRSSREDREVRERLASLIDPRQQYPSTAMVARFGVTRIGLTCAQAQQKAQSAQRLADSLTRISQLNGAGTGLVGAISQGATRFVGPMAIATIVTGFAASWAGQLASAYRNASCLTGEKRWRFRPNALKTSLFSDRSLIPVSLPWQHGLRLAASRTGTTSRRPAAQYRFPCRSASGPSRWS